MAKETFENKMLNSVYETDKPRMQFLIDNKALTLDVVSYIERHMRFVSTRCLDNEKHWQVLSNFSDFLELKRLHEQIKEKQASGNEAEVESLQCRFDEIKKKFDVSHTENVLTAKQYEKDWTEFLQYFYITHTLEESVTPLEPTIKLPQIIAEWVNLNNPSPEQLSELIQKTHMAYLSDNGLQGFKMEVVDGGGVKGVASEQMFYVGADLINQTSENYLGLLSQVLSASELICLSTKLNKPLKGVNPVSQAMMYERAISIVNAIRNNCLVSNSDQLNSLLLLNSAKLIAEFGGSAGSAYYAQAVLGLPDVVLTQNQPVRIVEEYYLDHLPKMQQAVTKAVLQSKKQASLIK